jgi:hypothetical protein
MTFFPCQVSAASITQTKAAIGENCLASGDNSTAIGYKTKASGFISTAMGYETRASNAVSTAMGESTSPSTSLHVKRDISGFASLENHVAAIENTYDHKIQLD